MSPNCVKTPVVFLVFNRPELTRRVLAQIKEARPSKLFVVCDGPRENHGDDVHNVALVRRIIADEVDWQCEVVTNYSDRNLGCRERPASGINWVFSLVEEAIILEDDCCPNFSFFLFCEAMLERFRGSESVMHINGTNFVGDKFLSVTSYYYSKYVWVWGWATWRRAWKRYDYTMATWDEMFPQLSKSFDTLRERAFWISTFEEARQDWRRAQAWDFSWIYSCWTQGGVSVVPSVNLVENLGFGVDSTHTNQNALHLRMKAGYLNVCLHPSTLRRSRFRDDMMFRGYTASGFDFRTNAAGLLRILRYRLIGLGKSLCSITRR